jgi:diguanylate cyclase (GGDEF)-like protein
MERGDAKSERDLLRAVLDATRELDEEPFFARLTRGALGLTGLEEGAAYGLGDDGRTLRRLHVSGSEETFPERLDGSLAEQLAAPEGHAVVPLSALTGATDEAVGPCVALVQVLRGATRAAGLIVLLAPRRRAGALGDLGVRLARFADELVPALRNLRTVAALQALAIRDDTADCFNRRYLDHCLEDELERGRRFKSPFSVIFIDMDNLKEINTCHGHAAGSYVLWETSLRLGRTIRAVDRLFRYGGDEFLVLLPNTLVEGARELADRLRDAVAGGDYVLPDSGRARMTISAGVAGWPADGITGMEVVQAADSALRRVKARGKDDVGMASEQRDDA